MTLALFVQFVQTYGWEESDYGNLAMVYGVGSGFTIMMNHMPGYYLWGQCWHWLEVPFGLGLGSVYCPVWVLYLITRFASKWSTSNAAMMVLVALTVNQVFTLFVLFSSRTSVYVVCGIGFSVVGRATCLDVWSLEGLPSLCGSKHHVYGSHGFDCRLGWKGQVPWCCV